MFGHMPASYLYGLEFQNDRWYCPACGCYEPDPEAFERFTTAERLSEVADLSIEHRKSRCIGSERPQHPGSIIRPWKIAQED